MRYMQIIEARDVEAARQSYLELLQRRGIRLVPHTVIYIETVHRHVPVSDAFLCYLSNTHSQAA